MKTRELIVVRRLEDLPASKEYVLPGWGLKGQYRATAWAYLTRPDGGDVVTLNGQKYHATKPQVVT